MPEHYTWNYKDKKWNIRKKVSKQIGRLMEVTPDTIKLFHLRTLLKHVPGATGYQYLKTVNDVEYATYYEACKAYGLLENNEGFANCLKEMSNYRFPKRLRRIFALICCIALENQIMEMLSLYEQFVDTFIEDYLHQGFSREESIYRCLLSIEYHLKRNGKELSDFNLPHPSNRNYSNDNVDNPEQTVNEVDVHSLNGQQLEVYNTIMLAVENADNNIVNLHNMFYLDGPAGTGKTYIYNAIINNLRLKGKQTIAVAWTGIASTLLTYGTTVHRAFRLRLDLDEDSVAGCAINHPKSLGIKKASIIVWNEAPMSPRLGLEAKDRYLRDLMKNSRIPF